MIISTVLITLVIVRIAIIIHIYICIYICKHKLLPISCFRYLILIPLLYWAYGTVILETIEAPIVLV